MKIKASSEAALALEHTFLAKTRLWLEERMESGFVTQDACAKAVNEIFEAWVICDLGQYSNKEVATNFLLELDETMEKLKEFRIEAQKWL
ncbi:MAG: hypothetical protein EBU90_30455 [Proteobacteria bacterium]|nr:hypothetical protein [Pseudomonadota bacterium]NBP16937.1 hypothetical protein [bacterium]